MCKKKAKYRGTDIESWQEIDYSGFVWCPSTPNGIIFVRRNRSPVYQSQNSELWGFDTPRKRQLWTEMTIPPTLHGKAFRWVETYAGYSGVSELLEHLYYTGFVEGLPHPDFLDLEGRDGPVVRYNPDTRMFVYWDTEARMPWQLNSTYYLEEENILTPTEFRRIHKNEWVSSIESFIEESWWDGCHKDTLPPLKAGDKTPVVVGIDMAVTRDCAALVAVTRDPDSPDTSVAVRGVKVFNPKRFGGIIDQEKYVRPVIEEWFKKWNVVCWVYDPREMSKLAQDMTREGFGWFRAFGQTQPRTLSDKQLHDMILHRQLAWNQDSTEGDVGFKGTSEDSLYKHLVQAGASTKGDSYRIEKLSQKTKIDAAVALSQAVFIAMQLTISNVERTNSSLAYQLHRGEITADEFSRMVRDNNEKLKRSSYG